MGRMHQKGDFIFRGKKLKFPLRPHGYARSERLSREADVTCSDSEDEMVTDEETGQPKPGYDFLLKART